MIQEDTVVGGRYHLLRLIGQGGMAEVWEADDTSLERRVALKVLRGGDPDLAARLQREARALATLDHPGLVRLLDAGSDGGRPYVVMDLVAGPSLSEALDRLGFPTEEQAAALGAQLAAALAYVHRAGIVHRDVKPSNVLLDVDGPSVGFPAPATARLADFGVAQLGDASGLTSTGLTVGTAAYMAPEQLEGSRVGPAADVWALGMVLLECLTGRRVYQGTPAEVVARRLSGPVVLPPSLPEGWRGLLASMLKHDPGLRPDAAAVAATLAAGQPMVPAAAVAAVAPAAAATAVLAAAGGTEMLPAGANARIGPPVARPVRRRRTGPLVAGAIAALVLLVAIAAALASGRTTTRVSSSAVTATTAPPTTPAVPATTVAPTTTAPSAATAFSRLAGDVATAVTTGELPRDVGQQVLQHAQAAAQQAGRSQPGTASPQLQSALTTLDAAAAAGRVDQASTTTVTSDLGALAAAIGAAPPTPVTTQPAAPASPGKDKHGGGGGDGG